MSIPWVVHHLTVVFAVRVSGPLMAALEFAVHVSLLGLSGSNVLSNNEAKEQQEGKQGVECAVFVPMLQIGTFKSDTVPAPQVTRLRADLL